jgi:hypothetical protein
MQSALLPGLALHQLDGVLKLVIAVGLCCIVYARIPRGNDAAWPAAAFLAVFGALFTCVTLIHVDSSGWTAAAETSCGWTACRWRCSERTRSGTLRRIRVLRPWQAGLHWT